MASIGRDMLDIGRLDRLADGRTPIHRLDPRAKLLTTLLFVVLVASFGRYEISALLPFSVYPIWLCAAGGVPAGFLLRRLALVAPFVLLLGAFNPLLDRQPTAAYGPFVLSGGWISYLSLLLRFLLTVGAALALMAVTGIERLGLAMQQLGVPRPFVVQLLLLNRYLRLLLGEGARMVRARALRSAGRADGGLRAYASLTGHLLLRTLDRAERIHRAMLCRGFDGRIALDAPARPGRQEAVFVLGWTAILVPLRLIDLPVLVGRLLTGAGT